MTDIFSAHTANEVWLQAYDRLVNNKQGSQESRLGATRESLHANFHIEDPRQRWILSRLPAFNPAFAIAEVFWILSGDNSSSFLNYWNPILPRFAGEGPEYHGAYGYRIRKQFEFDQLEKAYLALKANPTSRQIIIQIWDPNSDFPKDDGSPINRDVPCNICAMPKIRKGKLEWLQIMRSNDLYRGTPHNIIQFSTMQEILAGWLNLDLGAYHQISDSLHVYEDNLPEVHFDDIEIPLNSDSLALPKEAYEKQLTAMVKSLHGLTNPKLSTQTFAEIINRDDLKPSYKNLLLINAADCARRRGWKDEMDLAKSMCNNHLLILAFNRWEERYPIE